MSTSTFQVCIELYFFCAKFPLHFRLTNHQEFKIVNASFHYSSLFSKVKLWRNYRRTSWPGLTVKLQRICPISGFGCFQSTSASGSIRKTRWRFFWLCRPYCSQNWSRLVCVSPFHWDRCLSIGLCLLGLIRAHEDLQTATQFLSFRPTCSRNDLEC